MLYLDIFLICLFVVFVIDVCILLIKCVVLIIMLGYLMRRRKILKNNSGILMLVWINCERLLVKLKNYVIVLLLRVFSLK